MDGRGVSFSHRGVGVTNFLNSRGKDSWESWQVCFAAFWTAVFGSLYTRSYGVFLVTLARDYGFSRQDTYYGFVGHIMAANASGIIAQACMKFRSIRSITTASVVMSSIGFVMLYARISFKSIIFASVLLGIGRGAITNQVPVLLTRHFTRSRTNALGVYKAGMSVSIFIFPLLTYYLVEEYGLRGCCLILAAVYMNAVAGTLMFREKPSVPTGLPTICRQTMSGSNRKLCPKITLTGANSESPETVLLRGTYSSRRYRIPSDSSTKYTSSPIWNGLEDSFTLSDTEDAATKPKISKHEDVKATDKLLTPQEFATNENRANFSLESHKSPVYKTTVVELNEQRAIFSNCECFTELFHSVWMLFKNPMFYILSMLSFSVVLSYTVTAIIVDATVDKNIEEEEATYLLTVVATFELAAELAIGFLTKESRKKGRYACTASLVGLGCLTALMTATDNMTGLVFIMAGFGLCSGLLHVFMSVQVHEYMGQELFALSNAVIFTISGCLLLTLSPVIGYYRDVLQNYDEMLIIFSCVFITSGLVWFLEPVLSRITVVTE